jgi:ParB family chromosome partitioning protein
MKPGLHLDYEIKDIVGADYHPRRIDNDAIEKLKHSLSVVGCAKPIIVRGRTIVAGHQRTKALRAMGVTRAPVYLLPTDASTYDEVRFNQLHNGTDLDTGDESARVVDGLRGVRGFTQVEPDRLSVNQKAAGANIRHEIMRLVTIYGSWGACVASESGEIFHAAQYALSMKTMGKKCLVYVVPAEREAEARELLGARYGVFSYDNLPRETYIQTFAQMFRLREDTERENASPTYVEHVIPWLQKNPGARVLDFGCGQGDYVRRLSRAGHAIQGMEFFRRAIGKDAIDVAAVNGMVDSLISSLKTAGRFDAVVCDYVLNSVDTQQAEDDVLTCLAAFCKPGGHVFFSGRKKERIDWQDTMKTNVKTKQIGQRYVEFIDEHGLSALYRKGRWFYQKFHSRDDIANISARFGFAITKHTESAVAFQLSSKQSKTPAREYVASAIDREFNMPLNSTGRRLGRHNDVKETLLCLL